MRRRFTSAAESSEEQINLTPMLDVVFIMLIFFIVTATFVKETGLDVQQPKDSNSPPDPNKKSIVVKIDARDRVSIGGRDVDLRSVRANIERLHAENPEAPVIIQPAKEATTNTIVGIMDASLLVDANMTVQLSDVR